MDNETVVKKFNLEDRTLDFSKAVRVFVKNLPRTISNIEDSKQLVRSSGSVGSNYIEANEALSKKDFLYRIKICRKEAKETRYWLNLLDLGSTSGLLQKRDELVQEAQELLNIFGAVIRKTEV